MTIAAASSFWINGFTAGGAGFSAIHLQSVWTLIALGCAVYFIRRGNVRAHRGFMIGTYMGLWGAGIFALFGPGRLLNDVVFGG